VIGEYVDEEKVYATREVDTYVDDFLSGVDVNVLAYG